MEVAVRSIKNVFWVVAQCRYCVNRRFEGSYRLHLQGRRICEQVAADCTKTARLHIPENGFLHRHLHENLKSYMKSTVF
jgi:hypothetical protein